MSLTCCSWPAESGSGVRDGKPDERVGVDCGEEAVVAIIAFAGRWFFSTGKSLHAIEDGGGCCLVSMFGLTSQS
jgi:hypothetical protein